MSSSFWLGSSSVGMRSYDVDAHYEDGYVWLGNNSWNSELNADARYEDGCVWLGASDVGHRSYDTDARYDGPDDGAAAATVLLLLLNDSDRESISRESSSNREISDSESCEEDEANESSSCESISEVPYDERFAFRRKVPQEESDLGLLVIAVIILLLAMGFHYFPSTFQN